MTERRGSSLGEKKAAVKRLSITDIENLLILYIGWSERKPLGKPSNYRELARLRARSFMRDNEIAIDTLLNRE